MAMFNSYINLPEGIYRHLWIWDWNNIQYPVCNIIYIYIHKIRLCACAFRFFLIIKSMGKVVFFPGILMDILSELYGT